MYQASVCDQEEMPVSPLPFLCVYQSSVTEEVDKEGPLGRPGSPLLGPHVSLYSFS